MFERRLRWLFALVITLAAVIALRLFDIQVVRADFYKGLGDDMLTRKPRFLNAPRGSIFDRAGRLLVSDEPTSDICLHYGLIAGREDYLAAEAREMQRRGDLPAELRGAALKARVDALIERTWATLSDQTGRSREELAQEAAAVVARVEQIREDVAQRTGLPQMVREEAMFHPVIDNVPAETALSIREALEDLPWLRVAPSTHRVVHGGAGLAHVIGRLGQVSTHRLDADPLSEDELYALQPGDACGVSGVEKLAETVLRGKRGRIVENEHREIIEQEDPIRGRDVTLTLDAELQEGALEILRKAVEASPYPAGGAAVVIDAHTREIVVLAQYPSYDPAAWRSSFDTLIADRKRQPTRFRTVANQYAAGSTCKAITLIAGLTDGIITDHTTFVCNGHLLPNVTTRYRCWIYNQYGSTHGPQTATDAVRNSCNIFFFKTGEACGCDRLCRWFRTFGLGELQGTGLIEETAGIVPDEDWLRKHRGRGFQPADAWNFAIGQGEVTVTPLQVANVCASIADGRWAPVLLVKDENGQRVGPPPPPASERFSERALHVLREGMYRVVNEQGGTAYGSRLRRNDYVICGKTGSAQAAPRVLDYRYTLEWPDGKRQEVVAASREEALARYPHDKLRVVGRFANRRYPDMGEDGKLPAHAWFMGWTQRADTRPGDAPRGRVYALAVLVEFGSSGGHIAGPAARDLAEFILAHDDAPPAATASQARSTQPDP